VLAFAESPRAGAVYNLGGGRANSISILEAIAQLEELTGAELAKEYVDEARRGDHICYISDLSRFQREYPSWRVTVTLEEILRDLVRPSR
jgi:CDP-paratose 2-epimerase